MARIEYIIKANWISDIYKINNCQKFKSIFFLFEHNLFYVGGVKDFDGGANRLVECR